MTEADIAVVGGGILGLAVARELGRRHPGRRIVVLEREAQVGEHQTGHNSGVVHAGIYYVPGSLKARLCVEGVRELRAYCEERGIAYEACGKLIVALGEHELPGLDELERRGIANGVPGLRRLDAAGLRADLTGLGADPVDCPPDELPDVPVLLTVVDGEIVHRAA